MGLVAKQVVLGHGGVRDAAVGRDSQASSEDGWRLAVVGEHGQHAHDDEAAVGEAHVADEVLVDQLLEAAPVWLGVPDLVERVVDVVSGEVEVGHALEHVDGAVAVADQEPVARPLQGDQGPARGGLLRAGELCLGQALSPRIHVDAGRAEVEAGELVSAEIARLQGAQHLLRLGREALGMQRAGLLQADSSMGRGGGQAAIRERDGLLELPSSDGGGRGVLRRPAAGRSGARSLRRR